MPTTRYSVAVTCPGMLSMISAAWPARAMFSGVEVPRHLGQGHRVVAEILRQVGVLPRHGVQPLDQLAQQRPLVLDVLALLAPVGRDCRGHREDQRHHRDDRRMVEACRYHGLGRSAMPIWSASISSFMVPRRARGSSTVASRDAFSGGIMAPPGQSWSLRVFARPPSQDEGSVPSWAA